MLVIFLEKTDLLKTKQFKRTRSHCSSAALTVPPLQLAVDQNLPKSTSKRNEQNQDLIGRLRRFEIVVALSPVDQSLSI